MFAGKMSFQLFLEDREGFGCRDGVRYSFHQQGI